jgi:Tol biopolymer transport system component
MAGSKSSRFPSKRSLPSGPVRRLLLIVLVPLVLTSGSGDAAQVRISGRIVFASERGSTLENSDIYSVRVDGSHHRALVRNPAGGDGGSTWSPNGKVLAFWSERSGAARGLYLMTARGQLLRRLTPRGLVASRDSDPPSWSPDGRSLAFSGEWGSQRGVWTVGNDARHLRFLARNGFAPAWSPRGDTIAYGSGSIFVVPAHGGPARRLTRGGFDSGPAWSPGGRTLAFVRSDENGVVQALDVVSASGGRPRRLFGGRDVDIGRTPEWSPSGRLIAFVARASVYVVRTRDAVVNRLRGGDWPAWSPSGTRLAFTSGSGLYVMNAKGSRMRRVRIERGFEFSDGPAWSPDGRTLVYSLDLVQSDVEIFSVAADGSGLRQLTRNSVQDWMPSWSPSRRRIAFVRRGAIWVMAADGTRVRRLFPGSEPSWSPDGTQLAFDGPGGVSVRSLSGGPPRVVANGSGPAWSPGGGEIAFARGSRVLVVDLVTGVERTLSDVSSGCSGETGIERPDWSPDGRSLVYAVVCDDGRFASTSAEIVSADGSGRRSLPIGGLDTSRLAWSPDGTRLVFVAEAHARVATAKLDGTGRKPVVKDESGAAYLDPDW